MKEIITQLNILPSPELLQKWIENEEFSGWTEDQLRIFVGIVLKNFRDNDLAQVRTGDRVREYSHINARKGFAGYLSIATVLTEKSQIQVRRIVDNARTFTYDQVTGINLHGPSYGFIERYIPLIVENEQGGTTKVAGVITDTRPENIIDLSGLNQTRVQSPRRNIVYAGLD